MLPRGIEGYMLKFFFPLLLVALRADVFVLYFWHWELPLHACELHIVLETSAAPVSLPTWLFLSVCIWICICIKSYFYCVRWMHSSKLQQCVLAKSSYICFCSLYACDLHIFSPERQLLCHCMPAKPTLLQPQFSILQHSQNIFKIRIALFYWNIRGNLKL